MESRGYRKMLPVYLGEVGEKFHQKYIHTDIGNGSNQIYFVVFMCTTFDTRFNFIKKSNVAE